MNITKYISILLLGVLMTLSSNTSAQAPVIQWQRTIGGSGNDRLQSIRQTADGGYIVAGYSTSGISGEKTENTFGSEDYWILKLDGSGNILWQKTFGGAHTDILTTIIPTADGGFLASGWSISGVAGNKTAANRGGATMVGNFNLGRDYWLIKMNSMGVIQWQETYGGTYYDMGFGLLQHPDGGFVVTGLSYQGGGTGNNSMTNYGQNDFWLLKLDPNGAIQWQNSFGGNQHDGCYGLSRATGGGYIIGGEALSGTAGNKTTPFYGGTADNWIVKTNAVGQVNWQVQLGGSGQDIQVGGSLMSPDNGITFMPDSGYLVGLTSNSPVSGTKTIASKGGFDYWVVKLDSFGIIQWQDVVGGTGDEYLGSIFPTTDGGYLYAGHSSSGVGADKKTASYGGKDWWLVKKDAARNEQWQLVLGGSDDDELMTASQTADGGYIVGGYSRSGVSGNKSEASRGDFDFWIVKLGPCDTTPVRRTVTLCYGEQYRLPDGSFTTTPGIYYDTLLTIGGNCDSVIITTLGYHPDNIHLMEGKILGKDTSYCEGYIHTLDATYSGATYLWSTGAITPTINITNSGSYSVQITSSNGCIARDTISVTIFDMPIVDLGPDFGICDRDTPISITNTQPPGYQYLWSNGLSNTAMLVFRTGIYWLKVSNGQCSSSDTIQITVVPTPQFSIGNDTTICMQIPAKIGAEIIGATHVWNTGATTSFIDVNASGTYVLEINKQGCVVSDTVEIIAMPDPEIDLGNDDDICANDTILLEAGSNTNYRYYWNTGDTSTAISVTTPGTYIVTVLSEFGCIGHDSITLTLYPEPIVSLQEDTSVCEETPLVLHAKYSNADYLIWSDGSSGSSLTITYGGDYIATAVNKCGSKSDTITVRQLFCNIWVPNAFSPDADGRNDVFRALGNLGRLENFGLSVFNRWGQRIFHTQDKYQGWDGIHDGRPASVGTYLYLLEYTLEGQLYSDAGSFHLLR